jgi:hypothetical protein
MLNCTLGSHPGDEVFLIAQIPWQGCRSDERLLGQEKRKAKAKASTGPGWQVIP